LLVPWDRVRQFGIVVAFAEVLVWWASWSELAALDGSRLDCIRINCLIASASTIWLGGAAGSSVGRTFRHAHACASICVRLRLAIITGNVQAMSVSSDGFGEVGRNTGQGLLDSLCEVVSRVLCEI
jgi:hypothetical protein